MNRLEHLAAGALLALVVSTSGCYTKVGLQDPYDGLYGSEVDYGTVDYWSEPYYAFVPYAPWEAFPGHSWWYDDYHRYWTHPGHSSGSWDGVETGRHRNDRGPGIATGVPSGGGGRVSAGPPAPTGSGPTTQPADTTRSGEESTNPARQRAVSDDDSGRKKTESTEPTRPGRRR